MKNFVKELDSGIVIPSVLLFVVMILAAVTGTPAAQGSEQTVINRYIVAVSANYGGKGRPTLRYAESDAKSFGEDPEYSWERRPLSGEKSLF